MKKYFIVLFMFILCTFQSFAFVEEQRYEGILEFHQKLDPIRLYVAKGKPSRIDFEYKIRSYFLTDPKLFTIKAGFEKLFDDRKMYITALNSKVKTHIYVEVETPKVKKRVCHLIEVIEDEFKAEERYYISPATEQMGLIIEGVKGYKNIDVKDN